MAMILKRSIQFIALFFFLAHGSLPHRHHDELSPEENQKEHQQADSFFDYLAIAFHADLGDHNLKHVITLQTDQEIAAPQAVIASVYSFPFHPESTSSAFVQPVLAEEFTFLLSNQSKAPPHRRGPPSVS